MNVKEFYEKHPNSDDYVRLEEFLEEGYPYIRCEFAVNSTVDIVITAPTIEHCCGIAHNLINLIEDNADAYSDNEEYLERMYKRHKEMEEWREANKNSKEEAECNLE